VLQIKMYYKSAKSAVSRIIVAKQTSSDPYHVGILCVCTASINSRANLILEFFTKLSSKSDFCIRQSDPRTALIHHNHLSAMVIH